MPTNSWYLEDYQKERGEKIRLVGTIMSLCVSWFLDLWCGYFVQICAELQWSISAVTGHWTACDRIWCKGDSQMGCTWLAPKQRWFTSGRHGVLRECRYGRLQPLYHLSVSELWHQLPPYPGITCVVENKLSGRNQQNVAHFLPQYSATVVQVYGQYVVGTVTMNLWHALICEVRLCCMQTDHMTGHMTAIDDSTPTNLYRLINTAKHLLDEPVTERNFETGRLSSVQNSGTNREALYRY